MDVWAENGELDRLAAPRRALAAVQALVAVDLVAVLGVIMAAVAEMDGMVVPGALVVEVVRIILVQIFKI